MIQTIYTYSYPYRHKCLLAERLASSKQIPRAVLKRSFPFSKNTTGVQMEFGRMGTSYQRSASPQRPSDVILKTKADWMRVKQRSCLTDSDTPSR